ncbi:MAG: hypothetical protein H6Q70_80 [Firmicutes bacterium]|nr:hypothetical protein [Bacillota bacterium]
MNSISYVLRSKDIPLVEFDLHVQQEKIQGEIDLQYHLEIKKVYSENVALMPKNLSSINERSLLKWIQNRKAPKNRQFVNKIMTAYEDNRSPISYVDVSYALSVNDAYWVTNQSFLRRWKDCNLYEHKFDEILAYVAFTGHSEKISGLITSPEFTTDGAQKKSWSNRYDDIYLIKGGTEFLTRPDGRSDIFSEYYASQVAEAMGFFHVAYDLEEFKHKNGEKELVSICKLFTSESEGYVPIYYLLKDRKDIHLENIESFKTELQIGEIYGEDAFQDLMLFDSIIYNVDRHLKNFGVLVDNDTGKIIGSAPLFDHGMSLLVGAAGVELEKPYEYVKTIKSAFDIDFDLQAKRFVQKRHIKNLRKLTTFHFKRHEKFNLPDKMLIMIELLVQKRGRDILQLYHEKNNNLVR